MRPLESIRFLLHTLRREHVFRIAMLFFCLLLVSSFGFYFSEQKNINSDVKSFGDALWWSVATVAAVGYGDIVPTTFTGKVVGAITILSGMVVVSLITATIVSEFVERKIKEEEGLSAVKTKGQLVICGWNDNGEKIIEGLIVENPSRRLRIVLINELSIEEIDALKFKYQKYQIEYVRGDFTHEGILRKANISSAQSAIILADRSGKYSFDKADERTILGTLAINSIAPQVKTCAELLDIQNKPHLRRTKVDEIIVRGEYSGSLLASAALSPGLSGVVNNLLSYGKESRLWKTNIPKRFTGKSFRETSKYFRENHQAILIAIITEEKELQLQDILSDDFSPIDNFIKKKFEESDGEYFAEKEKNKVLINPEDAYNISKNDTAVVIAKEKP